jgi:hypothetical protein
MNRTLALHVGRGPDNNPAGFPAGKLPWHGMGMEETAYLRYIIENWRALGGLGEKFEVATEEAPQHTSI